jgi:hypothetical protein
VNEQTASVFRKFGYFAFMGVAALILAGPVIALLSLVISLILAVLSILVPFAVIGLLIWLPIRILSGNPSKAWTEARKAGGVLWRSVLRPPLQLGKRLFSWFGNAFGASRGRAQQVGGILMETTCGAAVGALLGVAAGMGKEEMYADAGLAAAVGAVVGLFVGFTRIGWAIPVYSDEAQQPAA